MTTYAINLDGEQVATMTADFSQASCPLELDGDSTPFQVSDARHTPVRAARLLLEWAGSDMGLGSAVASGLISIDEIDADENVAA